MGRKRKLKKVCCDQEVQEQNVATPKLAIEEQNVTALELATKTNVATLELGIGKLRVDETNIQCNLKLAHVIVFNPSDEIYPKTNWEF
jgi:hypothetical protein